MHVFMHCLSFDKLCKQQSPSPNPVIIWSVGLHFLTQWISELRRDFWVGSEYSARSTFCSYLRSRSVPSIVRYFFCWRRLKHDKRNLMLYIFAWQNKRPTSYANACIKPGCAFVFFSDVKQIVLVFGNMHLSFGIDSLHERLKSKNKLRL